MRCPLYPVEQSASPISQHSLKQGWPAALWLRLPQLMTWVLEDNKRLTLQRVLGVSWRAGTNKPYQSGGMVQEGRAGRHSCSQWGQVLNTYKLWHGAHSSRGEQCPGLVRGCLGGCAPARQHLEELTGIFPRCGSWNKSCFQWKKQSKVSLLPLSVWAGSGRGQVMLVMPRCVFPRREAFRAAPWHPAVL